MNVILTVAGKEFHDGLRNRWVIAITVIFAALALGIAYFGAAASGRTGFSSLAGTVASLAALAAFVVPLIGLLIAYDTVVGERDGGTLLLLLSYPLSRAQLLTGKFLGHSAVLSVAAVVGFGGALLLIQLLSPAARGADVWLTTVVFVVSASLLGCSFAGAACLVSVFTREKSRAAGLSLLVWFGFVVAFDLVLLAVLVASGGNPLERVVYPYLMLLNPIDVFRLINLQHLAAAGHGDVLVAMAAGHRYQPVVLYGALLWWSGAPFLMALFGFRRQEV